MTNDGHWLCSVTNCPRHATEFETGVLDHWRVTIHYCDEHWRELDAGIPLGATGIDPSRIEVAPLGTVEPLTGGPLSGLGLA